MVQSADQKSTQQRLETLSTALQSGAAAQVRQLLASLHPAEIGDLLQSFPRVILTTGTDVVGFMAFLGLGTWYLL